MDEYLALLIPVVLGMLLLCVGYSYRDYSSGVASITLGMLLMLGTAAVKILATHLSRRTSFHCWFVRNPARQCRTSLVNSDASV
jgi:hypothetical protein